jgi:hypothetical protein
MAGAAQADCSRYHAGSNHGRPNGHHADRPVRRDPVHSACAPGEVSPVGMSGAREIERALATFARAPNGGLIVTDSALAQLHRYRIIMLADRPRLRWVNRSAEAEDI